MSSNSLYVDHATRNITQTTPSPSARLTSKQKPQKLGGLKKLKEKYPEKQADRKMKGSP